MVNYLDFIKRAVNIFSVCYVYENSSLKNESTSKKR